MDPPTSPDGGERAWDRPWSTDEMREHKDDWSLACDVGLFRHLQKFSEDLTDKVKTTESSLDSLINDLKESSVMIENVTNVSLGLANTQFIESRVYEDETIEKAIEKSPQIEANKELTEAEMVSVVSESIKQSLNVMNEKYERIEVLASSESEDETDIPTPSVILKPQNPYQNRPLPYVIGSEKWKTSSKIGLESSSSESDIAEEEEEEEEEEFSESDQEIKISERIFNSNKHVLRRSRSSMSTSSSDSSRYDEKSDTNGASSRTDKVYTKSQDTLNSTSEIETPIAEVSKDNYKKSAPSFAEELAKRLGNVLPVQKSIEEVREPDQASINLSQDDLFGSDNENDDVFNSKSNNIFGNERRLFDEKVSNSLWKETIKKPQTMIPASLDVPPPMNSVESKPKSAIDDLFGDNDSDDSDDIFAPKNSKFTGKPDFTESLKTHFHKVESQNDDNVMTSTPETNNNIPNLFEDDDDDDGNLFSPIERVKNRSPEAIRNSPEKPPGILVNQSDLLSSALGNRLFNQTRNDYSDSSENESIEPENVIHGAIETNESQPNVSAVNTSESIVAGNNVVRAGGNNEITTDSSGISIQPTSVNSTLGLSLKMGEPQMESTRLLSEEIYRERRPSDSLLNTRSRQQEGTISSMNNSSNVHNQAQQEIRFQESSSGRQEDIFDSDDVFGPPPLSKASFKSKSKVNSLFDDSDSGDDLFSNTSSGSRSQKSADQAGATQFIEKSKANKSVCSGLFDGGVNVFPISAAPDIDIFAESDTGQEPKIDESSVTKLSTQLLKSSIKSPIENTNLFSDEDEENLFASDKNKSMSIVNTNEDKSLAPISNVTEKIKKDSAVITMNSEEIKTNTSNRINSHNLFDDVDEEDDDSLFSRKSETKIEAVQSSQIVEDIAYSVTDGPAVSKQKSTDVAEDGVKKVPPKSLKIRLPIPGSDDSMQAPRKSVSGKIKNLMGQMGNLKILSPTDTPPLLRKSGEKLSSGGETPDQDNEDGGIISVPKSPQTPKEFSNEALQSPSILDTETAVSFDVPAQVETLSIASKSRAKIPTKRRPQSRQARQTALRHSGIDFHSVDCADSTQAGTEIKSQNTDTDVHRLSVSADGSSVKPSLNLLSDDKSEISLGKESSMSITKHTLLSPSTDEEDLFDVPPDLPEDPQKEDPLFGRAPILSPVARVNESVEVGKGDIKASDEITDEEGIKESTEPSDPLRSSNDPLKDPSQLFAFVTKTPSPEKGQNLLTTEDDNENLFSQVPSKKLHHSKANKASLDLFADEGSGGDLFAGPFTKSIGKKSTKDLKSNLFDDINSDEETGDDLFGSTSSKRSNYSKSEASEIDGNDASNTLGSSPKGTNVFGDDDDEDDEELFFDASEKPSDSSKEDQLFSSTSKILKTKLEDIFGEPSSGDDDIFSTKISKDSGQRYSNYVTDIVAKKLIPENAQKTHAGVKKSVTKDLTKTAEKIGEDPLSMFQDE